MRVVILTGVLLLAVAFKAHAKPLIGAQRSVCTNESDGTFLADNTSCSNFFVCYNGEPVSQSCGAGSYFDENLYCLPDTDNNCSQSSCSENGAYSPNSNCNKFYICYDGKLVEQSCNPGSYFDSVNLYCIPNTNSICTDAQCTVDGAFSPHRTECALFYVCYNGLLVEQTCGNGSYFDSNNLYCLPDTDGTCWTSTFPPTTCTCVGGYTEGEFVGSPDNCYSYYVCTDGDLVEQNCGYGNYFNGTINRCEVDITGECWPLQNTTTTTAEPCTCVGGYTEGEFVGSPDNCYSYYVCTDGDLVEQNCGYGNYFNGTINRCEVDITGECWQLQNTTTTTAEPCTCVGGYTEGEFVGSPDNCYSYYVCTDGDLVEQNCGYGNYFNGTINRCEVDITGECWQLQNTTTTTAEPCTCVGGYTEGEFVGSPDNCYSYYVCTDGDLVEQNCGYGNYFNGTINRCEVDIIGECWPHSNATTTTAEPCTCVGGYTEGEFVGSPDNCYLYYVCTDGDLVEQNCGYGNYFNGTINRCEVDITGECWPLSNATTTTAEPCTCVGGYTEGEFVGSPDNCYSYYVCTDGDLVEQNCGYGNYFNGTTKSCEVDIAGECWPLSNATITTAVPCTCTGGYIEGEFIPNPDNCSLFYICTQNELAEQSCGNGNYFDNTTKICERDIDGICWSVITTPAPCECNEGDLITDNDSCHSYYVCTQGELVAHNCETGYYFDSCTKVCVLDENGTCKPTIETPC